MYGVKKTTANRFKREALAGMKVRKKERPKSYNFGVSRADILRYRKQARA